MIIFGTGTLYGVPQTDAAGNAITNPTPQVFGQLQEIAADISFDEKLLHGNKSLPVAMGRGKGKLSFNAKLADIDIRMLASLFFGRTAAAGIRGIVDNFAGSIPTTPFTITVTPPSSGTWATDLGARYASNGIPLTRVASAPAAGQYSVAAGVYTFAAADTGTAVMISYEFTASSTSRFNLTMTNDLMGFAPSFQAQLSVPYRGEQMSLRLNNCVASKLALPLKNEDFSITDFDFTALADASDVVGIWSFR